MATNVPIFEPHPMLRSGHMQTVFGRYLTDRSLCPPSLDREIELADGDRLVIHDSAPTSWSAGDPVALVVHGLGGSAEAPYVVRLAAKLHKRGIRVVRMNLRNAGASFGLSRGIYHGGRTEDLRAVAQFIRDDSLGSPLGLVGFSLGASLVLKLAAEAAADPLPGLDCVVAANPPLDLGACSRNMRRRSRRIYDKNFVKSLCEEIARLHATYPDLGPANLESVGSVYEFDNVYTAPRNGFRDAEDYYDRSSAAQFVPQIRVDGLVVHAADDPFIPPESIINVDFPPGVALEMNSHGGHLGYVSRAKWDGDHRWLESRIAAWLIDRWSEILTSSRSTADHPTGEPHADEHPYQ